MAPLTHWWTAGERYANCFFLSTLICRNQSKENGSGFEGSEKSKKIICVYPNIIMIPAAESLFSFPWCFLSRLFLPFFFVFPEIYCSCQNGVLKLSIFQFKSKEEKNNVLVKTFVTQYYSHHFTWCMVTTLVVRGRHEKSLFFFFFIPIYTHTIGRLHGAFDKHVGKTARRYNLFFVMFPLLFFPIFSLFSP